MERRRMRNKERCVGGRVPCSATASASNLTAASALPSDREREANGWVGREEREANGGWVKRREKRMGGWGERREKRMVGG